MKSLLIALSLVTSLPAFAYEGDISKVNMLPNNKINCALLFSDRGIMAALELSDGGKEGEISYLRGHLTLKKGGQIIRDEKDLDVVISKDLSEVTVGALYLNGEEGIPQVAMHLRKNDQLTDLSEDGTVAYTGAVDPTSGGPGLSHHAASNAACGYQKK